MVSEIAEIEKPEEREHALLQWGQYKRRRIAKSCMQKVDMTSSSLPRIMHHVRPAFTENDYGKREQEKSDFIDHGSPISEKANTSCLLLKKDENINIFSPHQNGQTRRRSELESLHDRCLSINEMNLAAPRWPRLFISLSHKEKEDDFMAMKGSRLPQRPKKRAKMIEKYLMNVSPGVWLCEVSLDRYEVREKKLPRRKLAGLKAMESLDSDSGR